MLPDDLATVKDDMVAFIAGHGLRRMKGYVPEEVPSVVFEEDDADGWKDFVEHAKAAGAPFLTMSEVTLEPEDIATLIGQIRDQHFPDQQAAELDEAQELTQHVGKTGYLQLGFAQGGVMFVYESATEWYDQFQRLMETVTELGEIIVDDREDD
jgi:ABC-type sugar transport system substrate-binding protein